MEPSQPANHEKMAANKKRSRSRGIGRPTITKLEEDPKNLKVVVGRQLIELLEAVSASHLIDQDTRETRLLRSQSVYFTI